MGLTETIDHRGITVDGAYHFISCVTDRRKDRFIVTVSTYASKAVRDTGIELPLTVVNYNVEGDDYDTISGAETGPGGSNIYLALYNWLKSQDEFAAAADVFDTDPAED